MTELEKRVDNHETRLVTVENSHAQIADIAAAVDKVAKLIRVWGPTMIGAAISAGIVNGKLGAFLHALLNGGN